MRALRLVLGLLALLALGACVPSLSGLFDAPNSARLRYGVASGDIAGFTLAGFSTRQVSAERDAGALVVTLRQGASERVLQLVARAPDRGGTRCELVTGTREGAAAPCSLIYLQSAGPGAAPIQARVVRGTLELGPLDASVAFSFEALLQAPTGGTFRVQGEGRAEVMLRPAQP